MRKLGGPLLAVLGGIWWGLCFGREPQTWTAGAALVPLILAASRRGPWVLGWIHGTIAWLISLYWIVGTQVTFGGLSESLASLLLFLLCLYLGLYHGLFAWIGHRLWKAGRPALVLFGLPAVWVALEWGREFIFGGFPWNQAAYAWVDLPGALPLAGLVGAAGVSYLLLWVSAAIALAIRRRRWEIALVAILVPLVVLSIGGRWGSGAGKTGESTVGGPVRILQPNTEIVLDGDPEAILAGYQGLLDLSLEACDRPGALLIWPESAAWPFTFGGSETLRRDLQRLNAAGCRVLFNSSRREDDRTMNSVFLTAGGDRAGGAVQIYDKRHLVPFGEYVPLAGVFSFVERLARSAGDFSPGRNPTVLEWRGELVGPAICFEVVFPLEVAALVRAGATTLVTVTNDAWYGDTTAPHQHFRAVRFRAAENRRTVLRAALTGISAVVEPDGSVAQRLEVGERGILRHQLVGRRDSSPFSRCPWAVPLLSVLLSMFAIFRARRRLDGAVAERESDDLH